MSLSYRRSSGAVSLSCPFPRLSLQSGLSAQCLSFFRWPLCRRLRCSVRSAELSGSRGSVRLPGFCRAPGVRRAPKIPDCCVSGPLLDGAGRSTRVPQVGGPEYRIRGNPMVGGSAGSRLKPSRKVKAASQPAMGPISRIWTIFGEFSSSFVPFARIAGKSVLLWFAV